MRDFEFVREGDSWRATSLGTSPKASARHERLAGSETYLNIFPYCRS